MIERVVHMDAKGVEFAENEDVCEQTCGVWKRRKSICQTMTKVKNVFRKSMQRHKFLQFERSTD